METTKPTEDYLPTAPETGGMAFTNRQIDLFQTFLCNTTQEREQLSNTIELWDSIPRYSVSRQAMGKLRSESGGFLNLLKLEFAYKGMQLKAIIQPARIEGPDGTAQDYYPGANEELVEDALRKIAAEQQHGFFDKSNYRSGVIFTLHSLRKELRKRGHTRSYQQIMLSLSVLSGSVIELRAADGKNPEAFSRSPYFPFLAAVSRQKLNEDPDAKWIVQFHPLVTQSIETITYRQFDYHRMMSLPTQLARWIHKQLAVKFTFAGMLANPFEIRYSTIKRDSAMLNRNRERNNVHDVDEALRQLIDSCVLRDVQKNVVTAARSQIVDVVYLLFPTADFVREVKAANKRLLEVEKTQNKAKR